MVKQINFIDCSCENKEVQYSNNGQTLVHLLQLMQMLNRVRIACFTCNSNGDILIRPHLMGMMWILNATVNVSNQ